MCLQEGNARKFLKRSKHMLWYLYDIIIHGSTWAKPSRAIPPARCLYNPRTSYWEPLQAAVRSPTEEKQEKQQEIWK